MSTSSIAPSPGLPSVPTPARRVLILNERDPEHPRAGGAEIHVEKIFSRLAARGHEIVQYSCGFSGGATKTVREGITIERRGPLPFYYASVPSRVRATDPRGEFDLVVECLNKIPFYAPLYARVPVLALTHHLFGQVAFDQVSWPVAAGVVAAESGLSRAYRDCVFLAISGSTRTDLEERGLPSEKIFVSQPGIDPPMRNVDIDASRPPRATYIGRLERYKRVDVLLRAAVQLLELFPDLELLIIGKGPERDSLERLARELGLEDRTRFAGFVTNAERDELLADTRVCAFPSEKEGWGLTVIEANALGTPVVARDAPGLRDSIRHEQTGLLVPPNDAGIDSETDAYAQALAQLLTEDASTLAMRRECLEWSRRFDWDRAADDMEQAIERSLSEAAT
jgi:glycosyltransferase involved in cell wall biosynthesis